MVQARDSAGYSAVAQQAAHRVEHLLVMVAVALQPDTLGVPEAAHLLAMVAAKADLPQVTVAVAAAVHLQDMVAAAKADLPQVTVAVAEAVHLQDMAAEGVELALEVPAVPALEVEAQAQED